MFAGAAREAVFSNPDVIRRVNAEFVAVALKAALVNNPGSDDEGRLYAEIGRSKPAPQGICVANSAGKALAWALTFENDAAVLGFLDHSLERFREYPDGRRAFATERYMRFPGMRLDDAPDSGQAPRIAESHAGKACPANPLPEKGTLVARVFGRALGPDGKPIADTTRQEHYVEERFEVPVGLQEMLAGAAGAGKFRIPEPLARMLVSHAYLGQLDVNPYATMPGGRGDLKTCELYGEKTAGNATRIRLEGSSEASGEQDSVGFGSDGRMWRHQVKLRWEGFIDMSGDRMVRILLWAEGSEKLNWGNEGFRVVAKSTNDVARLPAGHYIDLACQVRYGIIGEAK